MYYRRFYFSFLFSSPYKEDLNYDYVVNSMMQEVECCALYVELLRCICADNITYIEDVGDLQND